MPKDNNRIWCFSPNPKINLLNFGKNTFWNLDKYILKFGQIHFVIWMNSHLMLLMMMAWCLMGIWECYSSRRAQQGSGGQCSGARVYICNCCCCQSPHLQPFYLIFVRVRISSFCTTVVPESIFSIFTDKRLLLTDEEEQLKTQLVEMKSAAIVSIFWYTFLHLF